MGRWEEIAFIVGTYFAKIVQNFSRVNDPRVAKPHQGIPKSKMPQQYGLIWAIVMAHRVHTAKLLPQMPTFYAEIRKTGGDREYRKAKLSTIGEVVRPCSLEIGETMLVDLTRFIGE